MKGKKESEGKLTLAQQTICKVRYVLTKFGYGLLFSLWLFLLSALIAPAFSTAHLYEEIPCDSSLTVGESSHDALFVEEETSHYVVSVRYETSLRSYVRQGLLAALLFTPALRIGREQWKRSQEP